MTNWQISVFDTEKFEYQAPIYQAGVGLMLAGRLRRRPNISRTPTAEKNKKSLTVT